MMQRVRSYQELSDLLRCRIKRSNLYKIKKCFKENVNETIYQRIKNQPLRLNYASWELKLKWEDDILKIKIVKNKSGHPYYFFDLHLPRYPWNRWAGKWQPPLGRIKRFSIYGPACVMKLRVQMYRIGRRLLKSQYYYGQKNITRINNCADLVEEE